MSEKEIPQSDIRWVDKDFKFPVLDLRDYFAAKALTPLVDHSAYGNEREIAHRAYEIADAMIEARKS